MTAATPAPGKQGEIRVEPSNVVALCISLLAQVCLVTVLLDKASLPRDQGVGELTVRATFITPPARAKTLLEKNKRAPRRWARRTTRASVLRHLPGAVPAEPRGIAIGLAAPKTPGALDLSTQAVPLTFERNMLDRPGLVAEPAPSQLHVAMQDRSLAGRLRSLSKRRNCGELRAALSTRPESTAAILNAMERQGCDVKN